MTTSPGRKDDSDKPDFSLLDPQALLLVVKVLTFGAKKYGAYNWQGVPDMERRYFSAANRHLWAWYNGEELDESGLPHLAHAVASLLILLAFNLQKLKP